MFLFTYPILLRNPYSHCLLRGLFVQ